ncbi:MAG: hypothetical protein Q8L86_15125, partial [Vicinamibacterales bacterium]|nr:hypothetical protein [Vicinamibacterales bacterium]
MVINKLVFGGLALGCLATAAGGAYLATRHNVADEAAAAPAVAMPAAEAEGAMPPPVTASEGVISPETTPAPAPRSAAPEPRAATPEPR